MSSYRFDDEIKNLLLLLSEHVGVMPPTEKKMLKNLKTLDSRMSEFLYDVLTGMWQEIPDE